MEDFSRYGKNFQQKLVQLLFTDRYFADQLSDIIKPDYLELDYLQLLLRQFYKYKTTYDKYPTLETLLTLVKVYLEDNFICVEDNGRGMSQKDFNKLSKPYVRKKDQKETGTGLGLNTFTAIFGSINDYFEYCDYLNNIYAPKVEKLINNGYNIEDISEYAFECLKD